MKSSYNNSITYKELLEGIVFCKNPKTIIEFGILEGLSLKTFLENSNSTCEIKAYDIFQEFNGNSANREVLLDTFSKFKNVKIDYGNFYEKYKDIEDKSIDILHIDIANNGDILEFTIQNYFSKLSSNGLLIFEGGSQDRDNIEWMTKYNKPKINDIIQKYNDKFSIKTIGSIPSITLIKNK